MSPFTVCLNIQNSADQFFTQDSEGILDSAEANDRFGAALSSWDFGKNSNDGTLADLAIGVPGESVNSILGAGAVQVLYGKKIGGFPENNDGLNAEGDQQWTQNSTGIADIAETDDGFGAALY